MKFRALFTYTSKGLGCRVLALSFGARGSSSLMKSVSEKRNMRVLGQVVFGAQGQNNMKEILCRSRSRKVRFRVLGFRLGTAPTQ